MCSAARHCSHRVFTEMRGTGVQTYDRRALRARPGNSPDGIQKPETHVPNFSHPNKRCSKALAKCRTSLRPPLEEVFPQHKVACFNPMDPDGELGR